MALGGLLGMVGTSLENAASALLGTKDGGSQKRIAEVWSADKEARRPKEKQWQINVSYYRGQQWIGWNPASYVVEDLKAPSYRAQAVDNILFTKVRSNVTRLIGKPGVQVIPLTRDLIDERRARTKEQILEHLEREIRMDLRRLEAATWGQVCGTAYWDVSWREDAGDVYADHSGLVSEGEVGVRVRSPFDVWPGASASANSWGGRVWVCDLVDVEIARIKYNDAKIAPDAGSIFDSRLRAQLSSFGSGGLGSMGTENSEQKALADQVAVFTLYEFASLALPGGRRSTVINGRVAEEQPELKWFGLVPYHAQFNFSSFYGDTLLRQGIPGQKSHNRMLSSIEEYTRVMKGKWIAHESCKIRKIDSEHGEILIYSGASGAPHPVAPPALPSDLYNLDMIRKTGLDDLFSDHPASQGKAGSSASGAAINYLIEEDARQHTPNIMAWEASLERCYEKMLDVVADHYDEGRRIIVLGEDGLADVQDVTPEMLAGRNRVRVVSGSSLPASKVLRTELVRREYVDGMLGDPADPETRRKALRMIDAGVVRDAYADEYLDEARAERENNLIAAGLSDLSQMPIPGPEENHLVHLRMHRRHMKGRAYEMYPEQVKMAFEVHLGQHQMMGMAEMAAASVPPAADGKGNQPPASSSAVEGPGNIAKGIRQSAQPPPGPGLNQSAE